MTDCVNVDCETGRKLGCQTFCCRLLVRLDEDERKPGRDGAPAKSFVSKDADGYCVNFDRDTNLCRVWEERSRTCRTYNCNGDFLLQVAVRNKFANIVELVKMAAIAYIPKEDYIQVPAADE
jgi:Fe-S-cluster containining protein